jgi:hypothetical protein
MANSLNAFYDMVIDYGGVYEKISAMDHPVAYRL